ncbi:MAG: alpha/beta fold hydrolase [Pigmentiphaga sp.]
MDQLNAFLFWNTALYALITALQQTCQRAACHKDSVARGIARSAQRRVKPYIEGKFMAQVEWKGGTEHWTTKGDVRLFLWEKKASPDVSFVGTLLFIHGSSMASQPSYDLSVPGRPDSSVMDWFTARGFNTWCMDNEGYGRSSKHRPINNDISNGADDIEAGSRYILERNGGKPLFVYGVSSGALKAALFAQRHPKRVARLALDAFVWTGENSPTLKERAKRLTDYQTEIRRPINRAFVHSIFNRDHPGAADPATVDAFADAILTLDDSMPTGTYVDMCSRLPLIDPKKLTVPTLIMRGEYDGIASFDDLTRFFEKLPNMDKQFSVMSGISHASFQQKNYLRVYHLLHAFFTLPPVQFKG